MNRSFSQFKAKAVEGAIIREMRVGWAYKQDFTVYLFKHEGAV